MLLQRVPYTSQAQSEHRKRHALLLLFCTLRTLPYHSNPCRNMFAGVRSYAVDAEFYFRQHQLIEAPKTHNPLYFAPSHDNQAWSAAMMLAQLLDFAPAKQQLVDFFRGWMRGSDSANNPVLLVTPRGLHYLGNTPVPTAAEASMLALIYAHSTRGAKGGLSDHVISNMEVGFQTYMLRAEIRREQVGAARHIFVCGHVSCQPCKSVLKPDKPHVVSVLSAPALRPPVCPSLAVYPRPPVLCAAAGYVRPGRPDGQVPQLCDWTRRRPTQAPSTPTGLLSCRPLLHVRRLSAGEP